MRKVPTLFRRDPEDMRRLLREVHPDCAWVIDGQGVPTRKYDGTCVMQDDDGDWWARREVKSGKVPPNDFIEVERDEVTGKCVGWEPIEQSPFVTFWLEAMGNPYERRPIGTYELCGPKVNKNPERYDSHVLIRHADADELCDVPRDYDGLRTWLSAHESEGVVWHHQDGRMCKIKKRDFG